jgi:hypothetical protein
MNRLIAGGALAAFIVAMIAIAITSATSGGGGSGTTTNVTPTTETTATLPTTTASVPPTPTVKLTAVGAFDPEGDGHENDDLAPLAVDGNPRTYWKTEHYHSFGKKGVGLVLDAGRTQALSRVLVSTDGAGSSAQIELGHNPNGPFRAVTVVRPLEGTTTFRLAKGAKGRYVVVWITSLPQTLGEAHVTEVRAVGA